MPRAPASTEPEAGSAFPDLPSDAAGEREVMKAIYDKHKFVPQAVGEDAVGRLATVDSKAFWNGTGVLQSVYRRGSDRPIKLLPGDCVVGEEFKRFGKMYGGPLQGERPETVKALSKRDKAYFDARGGMKGPIAEAARKVESPHGRVLPPPPRGR